MAPHLASVKLLPWYIDIRDTVGDDPEENLRDPSP